MEGNFLSRYNNKCREWKELIKTNPENKRKYESEMADYVMQCMPYMKQYTEDEDNSGMPTNTDNIFNVKETIGLKRKDIFTDYLIEV